MFPTILVLMSLLLFQVFSVWDYSVFMVHKARILYDGGFMTCTVVVLPNRARSKDTKG